MSITSKMRFSWRLTALLAAILFIGILVLVIYVWWPRAERPRYALFTATQGGTYERFGRALEAATGRLNADATRVVPSATDGTRDNIDRLLDDPDPCFALVSGNGIISHNKKTAFLESARLIAPLYTSYLQVIASPGHDDVESLDKLIETRSSVEDAGPLRVYVGRKSSGTRPVAKEILQSVFPDVEYVIVHEADGFSDALNALTSKDGSFDVAFVFAGLPTPSVEQAMEQGCHLLSLDFLSDENRPTLTKCNGSYGAIPTLTYPKQHSEVRTLVERNFLVCSKDLPDSAVADVIQAIVGFPQTMQFFHPIAGTAASELIRLSLTADSLESIEIGGSALVYHSGAAVCIDRLRDSTVVFGGPSGGRYIELAEAIARSLRDLGETAYAIPTKGSQENLRSLAASDARKLLAIAQYDLAFQETNQPAQGRPSGKQVNEEDRGSADFFFLGAMHDEHITAFARDNEERSLMELVADSSVKVAVGSEDGGGAGTLSLLFPAVQAQQRFDIDVSLFGQALEENLVDAVMVVGELNSANIRQLLTDGPGVKQIPVSSNLSHVVRRPAIAISSSKSMTAGSDATTRSTLATRAVLLGSDAVANDRGLIRHLILQSESLGFESHDFAKPLVGLRTTVALDDARESLGLISRQRFNWVGWLSVLLAGIPAILALASSAIYLYNAFNTAAWTKQVLRVDMSAKNKHTVRQLSKIEDEIRGHVGNTMLELGVMSPAKWSELQAFLQLRRQKAEENYQRRVAGKVEQLRGSSASKIAALEEYNAQLGDALKDAWRLFQDGELSLYRFQELETLVDNAVTFNEALIRQRRKTA